jgi:hypothetical protein
VVGGGEVKTYYSEFSGTPRFWDETLGEWREAQTPEERKFVEQTREMLKSSLQEKKAK